MLKHPTQWLLLLVLMLGLVFVACGGDDDDDNGDTDATSTSEETATTDDADDDATATEEADEEDQDDESDNSTGGNSGEAGALLSRARERAGTEMATENVRFEMSMSFDGIDTSGVDPATTDGIDYSKFSITANGELNAEQSRSRVSMSIGGIDLSMLGGGGDSETMDFEMIEDGPTTYVRIPFLTALFGQDPETWISSPTEGDSLADSFTGVLSLDPESQSGILAGVDDNYEVIGEEELRGVKTTRLRVTVDEESAAAMGIDPNDPENQTFIAAGVPFDIWLDDDGRLHRMEVNMPFSAMGEDFSSGFDPAVDTTNATMSLLMELYDYGESVDIALPDPSKVVEEDALMGGFGAQPSATPE